MRHLSKHPNIIKENLNTVIDLQELDEKIEFELWA